LLEKLKSKISRSVFLQNPHKTLSRILDMLSTSLFRFCAKNCTVTEGIFLYKLSCDIDKSA
jgi:hypothetical protein